jgi:hypothetical protein
MMSKTLYLYMKRRCQEEKYALTKCVFIDIYIPPSPGAVPNDRQIQSAVNTTPAELKSLVRTRPMLLQPPLFYRWECYSSIYIYIHIIDHV